MYTHTMRTVYRRRPYLVQSVSLRGDMEQVMKCSLTQCFNVPTTQHKANFIAYTGMHVHQKHANSQYVHTYVRTQKMKQPNS